MMKKLIFPQEIEVWYVLPAIKKQLATELIKNGLSQSEVSQLMDCSRAAITQYTQKKRGQEILPQKVEQEIKNSSKLIIKNKSSVFQEIMRISQLIKKSGCLCQIHQKLGSAKCTCQQDCRLGV